MKTFVLFLCGMVVLAGLAEKYPRERYDSIVDREIFGPPPPGFDPDVSPDQAVVTSAASEKELTKEQEQLKSAIHFSVINVDAGGATVVGFTDNSDPKVPVHYYLKVGESQNGWTVKEADREARSMTIAKGEIEVALTLGGNSATGGGTTSRAGGAGAQPAAGGSAFGARPAGLRPGLLGGGSLRERRMLRRQEEQAAFAKQTAEREAKEAERQAQEAERRAQESQQREAERAEQRQQLLAIQEELKRVREAKAAEKSAAAEGSHAENDAQ